MPAISLRHLLATLLFLTHLPSTISHPSTPQPLSVLEGNATHLQGWGDCLTCAAKCGLFFCTCSIACLPDTPGQPFVCYVCFPLLSPSLLFSPLPSLPFPCLPCLPFPHLLSLPFPSHILTLPRKQGCITALGGSIAIAKTCRRCIPICRNKHEGLMEGACPKEGVMNGLVS